MFSSKEKCNNLSNYFKINLVEKLNKYLVLN